MNTDILI